MKLNGQNRLSDDEKFFRKLYMCAVGRIKEKIVDTTWMEFPQQFH